MSLDISVDAIIAAPRADVSAYVLNPAHDTTWIGGIREARLISGDAVAVGSRVARVASFLGRRIEYVNEIVDLEPQTRLVMRSVVSPFPMRITYAFSDQGGGTNVSVRVEGDSSGFYGLLTPFTGFFVRRSVSADLRRLQGLFNAA